MILGKGDVFQGNIQDHWEMESGKGLLSIQYAGFQLGQSSKALDLKDDSVVWNGKGGGNNKYLEHKVKDLRSERDFELSMLRPPA